VGVTTANGTDRSTSTSIQITPADDYSRRSTTIIAMTLVGVGAPIAPPPLAVGLRYIGQLDCLLA
jgi:hypothetical protein